MFGVGGKILGYVGYPEPHIFFYLALIYGKSILGQEKKYVCLLLHRNIK